MSIFAHDNLLPRIKSYAIVPYSQLILDAHIFTPGHSNSRQRGEEAVTTEESLVAANNILSSDCGIILITLTTCLGCLTQYGSTPFRGEFDVRQLSHEPSSFMFSIVPPHIHASW